MSPRPAEPSIAVVVPSRDRPDRLAACLTALGDQTRPPDEIVVVDDASVDPDAVLAAVAGRARVIRGEGSGPAAARNLGFRSCSVALVCFTDDDCRPDRRWIEALAARGASGASAVAGPTVNGRPDDPFATASQLVTNHLCDSSRDPASGTVGFAPTSNLAVRADILAALPFDETFPLAAGEDRDWCERLLDAGHVLHFEPSARVMHHQQLGWRGFWRQQTRYGRGAARLRRGGGARQPIRFYLGLLGRGMSRGPRVGTLVVVAQFATAVGLVRGSLGGRSTAAPPASEVIADGAADGSAPGTVS